MNQFLSAFLGTPKRAFWTIIGIMVIIGMFRPDIIEVALTKLLSAVIRAADPFIVPLFALGIALLGLRMIFHGIFGKKSEKKK